MKHAISVHLESFVFSSNPAIANLTSSEKKKLDNGSIINQVDRMLALFKEYGQTATIYTVSMIHEWYPDLVDRISEAGHEIAWHGHTHARLHTADAFRRELDQAGDFIRKYKPLGYCSPEFCFWEESYQLLKAAGFRYSNSCLSDSGPVEIDGLLEIPVSAYRWRGPDSAHHFRGISPGMLMKEIPFGSSFIIALIGGAATAALLEKRAARSPFPSNIFFHNWQAFHECELADRDRRWYFRKNPLYFPYLLNIEKSLRTIMSRIKFSSMAGTYLT